MGNYTGAVGCGAKAAGSCLMTVGLRIGAMVRGAEEAVSEERV